MPSGEAIANLAIATSYKPKDKDAVTEWHRVVLFGRTAEVAAQYLRKGSSVYIEGRLQTRKYTDKDGVERYATEIIGENLQMLGGREQGGQEHQAPTGSVREQARDRQANASRPAPAPQPAPRSAPNFSDMDDDIPF